jgi:hypothetical protein
MTGVGMAQSPAKIFCFLRILFRGGDLLFPALRHALGLILTGIAGAAAAQDLVGFDRASFGDVVLSRNQSAGVELEVSFGNYNNESITNYSDESVFARLGHSVGRLDILTDGGVFPCTAFIVDEKHILTNYHCVPGITDNAGAGASRIEGVQFVAGYVRQGVEEGTRKYTVVPVPVEADKRLDYAVLEVLGDPSADFGRLKLSGRLPRDGDPYWVIGHPMGEAQRISREQCRANRPALSQHQLLHTCDTLPGNSGSPVIDASDQMVIALHHAGSRHDSVNFAIPMQLILDRSEVLVASAEGLTPDALPPAPDDVDLSPQPEEEEAVAAVSVCDALYTEAKSYSACFAYRAYADNCTNHPFVSLAAAYLDENCAAPEPEPEPAPDSAQDDRKSATDITLLEPDEPPAPAPDPAPANLRPWCASGGLNPAERTICGDPMLAALDARMSRLYASLGRPDERGQGAWLRGARDACNTDASCIARAYEQRIALLRGAEEPLERPGDYTLPDARCYITVASRPSLEEARAFIRDRLRDSSVVRVFRSGNGYYGITYGIVDRARADLRLAELKRAGAIPRDAYCNSGRRYVAEIAWRRGGVPAPDTAPVLRVEWVNNNREGGLNLRAGPGTNHAILAELEAGTRVEITADRGNWVELRAPGGLSGWVAAAYLVSYEPAVPQCFGTVVGLGPRSAYNLVTGAGFLAVREDPHTGAPLLSEFYTGDRLKVVAERGNWARAKCLSGGCLTPTRGDASAIGWASKKYLSIRCQ